MPAEGARGAFGSGITGILGRIGRWKSLRENREGSPRMVRPLAPAEGAAPGHSPGLRRPSPKERWTLIMPTPPASNGAGSPPRSGGVDQSGQDLVMDVTTGLHLKSLDTSDFI